LLDVLGQQAGELLERDEELSAIADLVARTSDGRGSALLIEGEAGIGKTRLLDAVVEVARDAPVRVLRARGGELERSFPFGIAASLLTREVARLEGEQRDFVLSGAASLALGVVDPRVHPEVFAAGSEDALVARLHGLYWLCAGLVSETPLVLVVDDAHWADDPSLQWLLFLARRLGDMPLSLALAARPSSAGDWPEPLSLLRDEAQVSVVTPHVLSETASTIVVRRVLDADAEQAFCGACHAASGGNPFYLRELIAAVHADGIPPTAESASQVRSLAPEGIGRSVLVRLGRMSDAAGALARCVAVLGAGAELRHAAKLAELEVDAAEAAADALVAAGLLDAGRPLRLAHPVVRTTLYAELPQGARSRLHRRAASMLAADGADLDAVAAHLLAAEPRDESWAIDVLSQAATRAMARGAPATAAAYLRRAFTEPASPVQRASLLHHLGVAESLAGDAGGADALREAMRLARSPRQRAEIALDLSSAHMLTGRFGEAVSALDEAIEQTDDDPELRWRLAGRLIGMARMDGAFTDLAQRHVARLPRDLHGITHGERLVLAHHAVADVMAGEHVEQVAELATRALRDFRLAAEEPAMSPSLLLAIFALVLSERHELAGQAFDWLLDRTRREGAPVAFALVCSMRSQLRYYGGAIPDAIADARAAIEANRHFGWKVGVPSLYANLINALLEAGDLAGAEQALASSGLGEELPEMLLFCDLSRSRGRLRLAQGNTEAGIADLLAGHRLLSRFGIPNPAGMYCRSTAAVALARLNRRSEAVALAADELAAAQRFGAPGAIGVCLRAVGVVEGGGAGIAFLRDAVAHLERSPARLEHARALVDLGAALRRDGARRDAREVLRQGLDLADRCGGRVVADQARAELLIAGARPRRARISGADALTASELRVAQLAAEGLTNREIAQALFVSHPTVVTHLSHCYAKLGINNRQQLASVLGRTHASRRPPGFRDFPDDRDAPGA
jgi:DNA-binding CsgD family transcriptional regulator